jgi:hypothetical protein
VKGIFNKLLEREQQAEAAGSGTVPDNEILKDISEEDY